MTIRQRLATTGIAALAGYVAVGLLFAATGWPTTSVAAFTAAGLFVAVYVPTVHVARRSAITETSPRLDHRSRATAA